MSDFLEKGTLVGDDYEIIKPIARGGFSVVYLAKFAGTDSPLALKILQKSDQLDPVWVARFRREAALIRSFTHPNTVRILAFGEEKDFHYIAMEFVPGRSLFKQVRKHGALDAQQIAEIILLVCGAIEEAHKTGVLHRDLKPSNIMLTETEEGFSAKVLDFGSAKLVDLAPGQPIDRTSQGHAFQQLTQQGVFVGTPRYAAPEQLLQEEVDARVDIYGLGMVMWEALVGDPAVSKLDYASCIELHLGPKPWILPLSVNAPPEFTDIVHKALQKKKENRHQSVAELAEALRTFLEMSNEDSELRISISEVSDPFFDTEIFGDITGLEHDSDVPLLDADVRITPPPRQAPKTRNLKHSHAERGNEKRAVDSRGNEKRAVDSRGNEKRAVGSRGNEKRGGNGVDKKNGAELSLAPISEVEELELDLAKRQPRKDHRAPRLEEGPKKKTPIFAFFILLFLLAGLAYLVFKNTNTLKNDIITQIENEPNESDTLDHEFIGAALRSTGWILRQGDPIPFRDGVELRTLIADKKGLKTTINVYECSHTKLVHELRKDTPPGTDSVAFGSTLVRWSNTDGGAPMLSRTLNELKKMQK